MDIRVWMSAVYESLTPRARRKLSIPDRESFEIERAYEAKAIRECASMHHDGRLHQANLTEGTITRNRISVGVKDYTVRAGLDGG
jgi:hypothetical protein